MFPFLAHGETILLDQKEFSVRRRLGEINWTIQNIKIFLAPGSEMTTYLCNYLLPELKWQLMYFKSLILDEGNQYLLKCCQWFHHNKLYWTYSFICGW